MAHESCQRHFVVIARVRRVHEHRCSQRAGACASDRLFLSDLHIHTELGIGTGDVTEIIFQAMIRQSHKCGGSPRFTEYIYFNSSPSFLEKARMEFHKAMEWMKFAILNNLTRSDSQYSRIRFRFRSVWWKSIR